MFPLPHRLRIIARQQAAAHEDAQQAPAHARLHRGDGWRIEPGGGVEDNPACSGGVEHAVDDDAMKVQVGIGGVSVRGVSTSSLRPACATSRRGRMNILALKGP